MKLLRLNEQLYRVHSEVPDTNKTFDMVKLEKILDDIADAYEYPYGTKGTDYSMFLGAYIRSDGTVQLTAQVPVKTADRPSYMPGAAYYDCDCEDIDEAVDVAKKLLDQLNRGRTIKTCMKNAGFKSGARKRIPKTTRNNIIR